MAKIFNPNELVLEKIRVVEEYDPSTDEITGRYTQIESPVLSTSADEQEVTDAMGANIMSFYNAQKGTFKFDNSVFSLDLAANQFGSKKIVASDNTKVAMPVSETITVGSDHTVTLKYVPVGTKGAEIKFVKVINGDNTFGEKYEISSVAGEGKFTLDAASKKITLPDGVTGRVFVSYYKETSTAVKITKTTDGVPEVKKLHIHALFHNICNKNLTYAGVIVCPRAQIDPTSVDLNLSVGEKHSASYVLSKEYCSDESKLFDIIISED